MPAPSAPAPAPSAPAPWATAPPAPEPGASAPPTPAPALFSPASVWNQPLADDALIDPASAVMSSGLMAEVSREEQLDTGPWITPGANIYTVGPDQPTVPVALSDPTPAWRASLQAAFEAVPIPAGAQPGDDADEEMTVSQPSTDKLWEFFHMQQGASGWQAGWGGAIQDVSQSAGYFNSSSWPGASTAWGATATALPQAAGVITMADIDQGQIDHALAINLPYPCESVYSWPAQRTDGVGTAANCIPEGAHLRLAPGLDIPALHLPPLVQMMAEAAQRYGMIVRDQTQWAIDFWIQSPASAGVSNPFYNSNGSPSATGPFDGQEPNQLMSQFPWDAVEVLQMNLSTSTTQ